MQELTQSQLKELLSYDQETDDFTWLVGSKMKGKKAGTLRTNGYLQIRINRNSYYLHRLAWLYAYGQIPKAQIDHINCIKTDNRIFNLRECSRPENMWNVKIKRTNTSGFKGVSWCKVMGKWSAQIMFNTKQTRLGHFDTAELAGLAYQAKAKELHKEFYRNTIKLEKHCV